MGWFETFHVHVSIKMATISRGERFFCWLTVFCHLLFHWRKTPQWKNFSSFKNSSLFGVVWHLAATNRRGIFWESYYTWKVSSQMSAAVKFNSWADVGYFEDRRDWNTFYGSVNRSLLLCCVSSCSELKNKFLLFFSQQQPGVATNKSSECLLIIHFFQLDIFLWTCVPRRERIFWRSGETNVPRHN